MTYCSKCNLASEEDAKTCSTCGGKMEAVPICHNCGEEIMPSFTQCIGCGLSREEALGTRPQG
ncbi:MAG: zinc ribbon domain-containing protein [Patescibacteria group bacterium]|nr:zinc ribbon domain-containing protein [Patescibacteria group bacterium]